MSENLAPLTEDEAELMAQFCKRIAANGHFIPEPAFEPLHGLVSMWAPELVILIGNGFPFEILLAVYDGGAKEFRGKWHIPGGYNRWPEVDVATTCSRVAKREIGCDVTLQNVIGAYKWRTGEHPYGHPLSLYVECDPIQKIVEKAQLTFFRVDRLPNSMVEPHRRFICDHLLPDR